MTELDKLLAEILEDSTENNKYAIKEAYEYTMILSEKFYDPFDTWMDVGWTLYCIDYCCFPIWIKFSSKSYKFDWKNVPEYF